MKGYIGFDPGAPCALALLDRSGRWIAHIGGDRVAQNIDGKWHNSVEDIGTIMRIWLRDTGYDHEVVIEAAAPRPGEGLVSACKYTGSAWAVRGLCVGLGVPYTVVPPRVWKKSLRVTSDKATSLALARTLFPYRAFALKKKKDHNIAEAALIAYYKWRLDNEKRG